MVEVPEKTKIAQQGLSTPDYPIFITPENPTPELLFIGRNTRYTAGNARAHGPTIRVVELRSGFCSAAAIENEVFPGQI